MNQKKTAKSAKRTPSKSVKRSTRSTKVITKKPTTKKRPTAKKKNTKKAPLLKKLSGLIGSKKKTSKKRAKKQLVNLSTLLPKLREAPARMVILLAAVTAIVLLTHNVQTGASSNNGLTSVSNIVNQQQSQGAPSSVTTAGPAQSDNQFSTYPTWSQDFADYGSKSINQHDWNIDIGSPQNDNKEAEYYTNSPANLRISNDALVLEGTQQPEPGGLQYASASVDTNGKVSFLYGRIDVTAEVPDGVGTWPAVWFLPASNKYADLSPPSDANRYLNGGEIDLIEAVGFNPNIVYSIVHTLQTNQANPDAIGDFNQVTLANNNSQYYTYSLIWTPSSISFEVNGNPFFTYTKPAGANYVTWPFDQPFYMVMNLALGGSWGGEDTAQFPGNGIDNSALPASMNIKSIYYYPYLSPSQ